MLRRTSAFVQSVFSLFLLLQVAVAQDFKKEVIYQIITDRFFDGDTTNNNPAVSPGLYDQNGFINPSVANWRLYWGGDLAGIQQKMTYLKGMGVTSIWISPPVDNINVSIPDSSGNPGAQYHGYGARDFKRIEEHFGDPNNTWTAFDNLTTAAHQNGIKVIVDFAPNHTSSTGVGEDGALYNNGTFVTNYTQDSSGYFHHNPGISNWDDRYQVQYYSLEGLADFNQENSYVDNYLKTALTQLQNHGADGFRIDAVKHVTWGWEYSMANTAFTNKPSFFFGEWYQGGTSDTLFHDSYKFVNKSGISLLDFPLNTAMRNVFANNNNFSDIDTAISTENAVFNQPNDLVTFLDNHDMARFLTLNNSTARLHEAEAFLLTCRGIPTIYYGDEQYLHNDTSGGTDPYNRNPMTSFSTSTTAYQLISKLSTLRRNNDALGYGTYQQRWMNPDVYIYERKFFNNVVLVAINKNDSNGYSISGLNTSLPSGSYTDYLGGLLGGVSLSVGSGTGGNNPTGIFTLPAHSVSVWQVKAAGSQPEVGSIGPNVAQPGVSVTIAGENFGSSTGTVLVGTTAATVTSWSDTSVIFTVPSVTNGVYNVQVKNSSGTASNTIQFTVLQAKLIPVTFTVNNATPTSIGDYIFLAGNTVELGNWGTTFDTAVGPLLTPNYPNWFLNVSVPAGAQIQFKFLKIAANGTVTWENGSNHTYTVPTSGTGSVNVNWQY